MHDLLRALLTRPDGGLDGLVAALVEEAGRPAFGRALAGALGGASEQALRHAVAQALPDPADVLLTGAEAVALTLRREGVGIVFAAPGAGESPLRDAAARLGLLAEARDDREAAIQAGGAGMVRPGNGAAVLSGARGLADALGALADLRRDGIGTVVFAELPAADPGLLAACGAFAKSCHEPLPPPATTDGTAAAHALVTTVRQALHESKRSPAGPTLVALPQQWAQTTWCRWPHSQARARARPRTPPWTRTGRPAKRPPGRHPSRRPGSRPGRKPGRRPGQRLGRRPGQRLGRRRPPWPRSWVTCWAARRRSCRRPRSPPPPAPPWPPRWPPAWRSASRPPRCCAASAAATACGRWPTPPARPRR
ncbi:thiamine pyrophosphate-binding protein [Nonomuraea thailandensis]